jgi:hypothetical protein
MHLIKKKYMKKIGLPLLALCISCAAFIACKKNSSSGSGGTTLTLPAMYSKFNSSLNIYVDGNFVVIKTTSVPDHKSPYFATTDSRYEAYNGSNASFMLNPNRILEQSLTFKIPIAPTEASSKSATPLGPIGVSLNGVAIFNQYAGPATPLTNEINSFDQYNGHPQQTGQYHYHVEPKYITAQKGKNALLGVLLDGFPVYGPLENGVTLTSANLDAYHGHMGVTAEFPGGIYHYHITADAPYINGNGFWGTAGTVTQ